jgi:hypothetical protein
LLDIFAGAVVRDRRKIERLRVFQGMAARTRRWEVMEDIAWGLSVSF